MLSLILVKQILLIELQLEVSAFGQDLLDFSLDGLDDSLLLLGCHCFHLLVNSSCHLLTIFNLLANRNFVARIHHSFDVVL